jgi:bifunctional UDP-N-acetylglucosamine pyrophosphorylase/glucosamine-1-phosphate N-acetyltransferase
MRPNQLFSTPMEQEFDEWLSRFASLEELFSARYQLYSKLSRQQLDGIIEEDVTILGPVHVGPNAHIRSGAVLNGPLVIGPNVIIDHGAKVFGGTVIGTGTRVKSGVTISNSLLMNNCLVAESCIIQDSVLGYGVTAKAGCLIGDMASPEEVATYVGDGAKLGLGCIICAGSIVLPHQSVSPGTVLGMA